MTTSPASWIVGFDGSDSSRAAARWALVNARERNEGVHLVHAWSVASTTVFSAFAPLVLDESIEAAEAAARQELDAFVAELATQAPGPLTSSLVQGDASNVLLDASEHSDRLVVGARGGGRFDRLLLGSTSTRCATHSSVPTIVIRPGSTPEQPGPVRRIVVAVDGSANSLAAVDWACSFAAAGSTVQLVAVWEYSPGIFSSEHIYYPDAREQAQERFDRQLDDLPSSAGRDDIELTTAFVEGSPRDQIAAHAEHADLLVVGARGRGAVGAALLGSVSTWLLHHVATPIAVIPHDDD